MAGDGSSCRHDGADEMRAAAGTLPALEVAVRSRCAALARLKPVRVHAEAHRAAGLAPLEARLAEHAVESLLLGLQLHQARAGYHHRELRVGGSAAPLPHQTSAPWVPDAGVGPGADEDLVDPDVG